jgi:hypothetical protein
MTKTGLQTINHAGKVAALGWTMGRNLRKNNNYVK